MERRNFIQLSFLAGSSFAVNGCSNFIDDYESPKTNAEFKIVINPVSGYEIHFGDKIFDRVAIDFQEKSATLKYSEEVLDVQSECDSEQSYSPSVLYREVNDGLWPIVNISNNKLDSITEKTLFGADVYILEPQLKSATISNSWDVGGKVSNYYIRLSLEKHYLGSCIKKNVWHVGAMINNTKLKGNSQLVFDVHMAGWRNGRNVCFGVYESKGGWCKSSCSNDIWKGIRNYVYTLIVATVGVIAASAIADFIATAAVPVILAVAI